MSHRCSLFLLDKKRLWVYGCMGEYVCNAALNLHDFGVVHYIRSLKFDLASNFDAKSPKNEANTLDVFIFMARTKIVP